MSRAPVTKCSECGYEITLESKVCLNCGEDIKGTNTLFDLFKRVFFLLLAIYILLSALKIL